MKADELDIFFVETLKKILGDMKECYAYTKDFKTPEYEEINEDYEFVIDDLSDTLKSVKTIEDLAEMDEDKISNVFEYLESWADNFVVSEEGEQKKKDMAEYEKLEDIMDLFYDSDEEGDSDDPEGE